MQKAKPRPHARKLPAFQPVQLATLVDAVPDGPEWLHETKHDGFRCLLAVGGGGARAYTRSGLDWSHRFPAIVEAALQLPAGSALLDGEAVVVDQEGRSRFQALQAAGKSDPDRIVYYAFDALMIDGEDLKSLPQIERKARLAALLSHEAEGPIRYSEHLIGDGEALLRGYCGQGMEGIISKRIDAPYQGARTKNWLKIKCIVRQEFVIVGWTTSDKDRGFRALLLATHIDGELRYVGKVGTGFTDAEIERLLRLMAPLSVEEATAKAHRGKTRDAKWIKPKLVAEIAYTELTKDGLLRHPSYLGLREDKEASAVVLELAKKPPA